MSYRNQLIESLHVLEIVRNHIFTQVVNIAAENEYKEVLDVFEEGDSYEFEMEQFENSTDINIIKLMEVCRKIEEAYASIHNINSVKEGELIFPMTDVIE